MTLTIPKPDATTQNGSAHLESVREAVVQVPGISASAFQKDDANRTENKSVLELRNLNISYGSFHAVKDVTLDIPEKAITAFIGPSGCGKSTVLRCINRMNDLIPSARVEGEILYHGQDVNARHVDPVEVRRRIGMVFQRPNPFPKSIYENVAWGARINGYKGNFDELVEASLTRAALWDEVKDKLKDSGLSLSGGQQQRLCIARALATNPDVILLDEPFPAMYFGPCGYEIADSAHQHSIARFPREHVLISGAIHGEHHLAGLHAIVQMMPGDGFFTAFAFRPHFRTQMLASEQVLVNAIMQHMRHGASS